MNQYQQQSAQAQLNQRVYDQEPHAIKSEIMNQQAFTNAIRAITGDKREYPEPRPEREPWQVAAEALEEFETVLFQTGMIQSMKDRHEERHADLLQIQIDQRVNELRELITTGEIAP